MLDCEEEIKLVLLSWGEDKDHNVCVRGVGCGGEGDKTIV